MRPVLSWPVRWLCPLACSQFPIFSNSLALRPAAYGTEFMGRVPGGSSSMWCLVTLIRPMAIWHSLELLLHFNKSVSARVIVVGYLDIVMPVSSWSVVVFIYHLSLFVDLMLPWLSFFINGNCIKVSRGVMWVPYRIVDDRMDDTCGELCCSSDAHTLIKLYVFVGEVCDEYLKVLVRSSFHEASGDHSFSFCILVGVIHRWRNV